MHLRSRVLLSIVMSAASIALIAGAQKPISTIDDLVGGMQRRYPKWYRTATFVQKTTNFAADGTSTVATWYEAMDVPGKLRIDFTPVKDGNGILFADDKSYRFTSGKLTTTRDYVHPLMVLGFDVYRLPAATVIEKLRGLNFDVSIVREDTWQGRAAFVVGAKAGDLHSPQFWIDRDNLYFVRMIQPSGPQGAQTSETQFNKYQRLGGGWMSPEVVFTVDGKPKTTEEYSELRADVTLDPKLFDPQFWTTVHWKMDGAGALRFH